MHLPDFDEPFDPDLFSVEYWAKVPEPIRKIVEQHVAAHLPAKTLAKFRDLHARGITSLCVRAPRCRSFDREGSEFVSRLLNSITRGC